MKIKILSIVTLLLMAATGAVAQTETLLTTITATSTEQASYSTANVATVSFSNLRMRVRYTGVLSAMHISYRRRADTRVQDFSQKRVPRCPNTDVQGVCTLF